MQFEIPAPSMTFEVPLEDGARIRMRRHGNPDGVRLLVGDVLEVVGRQASQLGHEAGGMVLGPGGRAARDQEGTRVAEELRQRFLHVAGVKKVDIVGEQQERIFVEFSYSRLTTLGISPADVFAALARQNAVTPAGAPPPGPGLDFARESSERAVGDRYDASLHASGRVVPPDRDHRSG